MSEGVGIEDSPVRQGESGQDSPNVPRRAPVASGVREHGLTRRHAPEVGRKRFGGGLAEREPPHLRTFAEHRDGAPPEVDVAPIEPADLADPEPAAVEELEDRPVALVLRLVADRGLDEVNGLRLPRHPRQPLRAFGRPQFRCDVTFDAAVTAEVADIGANRRGLAGDRTAGEAAGLQVREVAAQGAVVDVARVGGRAALAPRDELVDVVVVRPTRVRTDRGKGGDETVGVVRNQITVMRREPPLAPSRTGRW
jgi:hypothetical protein